MHNPKTILTSTLFSSALLCAGVLPSWAADCAVKAPQGLVTPGYLTVGANMSTPPQLFIQNGQPAGFEMDLSQAIAETMCLKVRFINLAFGGLFPGLAAKKFDYVTSGLGITPQRTETFGFVPYFLGGIQLVGRKDKHFSFKDENGLCGLKVATISGTTQARAIERANREVCKPGRQISLKYFPSFNEAVLQLRKNSADIAFVDWSFAAYITGLMPELAVASPIISGRPEVPRNKLGLAFRKGEKPVAAAVGASIATLEKNGGYQKILDKWHLQRGDIRQVP